MKAIARWRKRKNNRGNAHIVEYLITIGALGLVVCTALALTAGPQLSKIFRHAQRSAASPMP